MNLYIQGTRFHIPDDVLYFRTADGVFCRDHGPHRHICTRNREHSGLHIATGTRGIVVGMWGEPESDPETIPHGMTILDINGIPYRIPTGCLTGPYASDEDYCGNTVINRWGNGTFEYSSWECSLPGDHCRRSLHIECTMNHHVRALWGEPVAEGAAA